MEEEHRFVHRDRGWSDEDVEKQLSKHSVEKLKIFNVIRSKLTKIPNELFNAKDLEYLFVTTNEITEIPAEFCKFENLIYLAISYNKLDTIPHPVFDKRLTSLVHLDLSYNVFTKETRLPACVSRLTNLQILNLEGCGLTSLCPASMVTNTS